MFMAGLSWRLTLINFIAFPIMIYISQLSGEFYEVSLGIKLDCETLCPNINAIEY